MLLIILITILFPLKGGRGGVNSVKKGMFLRIFFGDTDSVSLLSQFPYNNATFEQYFPKFSLHNIENWASDSESPLCKWQKSL